MPPALDPDHMPLCLVTLAGTEHTMPVNLAQYENLAQLEEDILSFLPTVSDIDVFGCQVDLVELEDQLPLDDAFQAVLLQHKRIQVIIRSCLEVCHSIWQTQESNIPSCPKAVHVPCNPRGAVEDRAFYAAPMLRHVEVAAGIRHIGFAAWQGCQCPQIVKLPPSVVCLADGAFQSCYVLREILAPGCIRISRRVLSECIALNRVGLYDQASGANICTSADAMWAVCPGHR